MSQSCRTTIGLFALLVAVLAYSGCDSGAATAGDNPVGTTPTDLTNVARETRATSANKQWRTSRALAEGQSPISARPVDKTFDDLKFAMEQGAEFRREMLAAEIEALAGKRIRIRGYILPTSQSRGIKTFVLVRDNLECCFGPGAALYDCIVVEMQPGKSAEYSVRPVTVEGTFHIELRSDLDGNLLAIYQLDADSVER